MNSQLKKMEHEYSERNFCKHCGWERTYIEQMGYLCIGPVEDQPIASHQAVTHLTEQMPMETPTDESTKSNSSDGLFSDGFFGLLNKGPIGWIIFGLLGGVLYGMYKSVLEWIN